MRRRASGMERLGVEECARRSGCEFGHSGCDFFRSVEPHEFVRAVHLARSITAFAISAHYASQGTVGFFGALVRGEHAGVADISERVEQSRVVGVCVEFGQDCAASRPVTRSSVEVRSGGEDVTPR